MQHADRLDRPVGTPVTDFASSIQLGSHPLVVFREKERWNIRFCLRRFLSNVSGGGDGTPLSVFERQVV